MTAYGARLCVDAERPARLLPMVAAETWDYPAEHEPDDPQWPPAVAVVPLFCRCSPCGGVFRTSTTWQAEQPSTYTRCLWGQRLTKLPAYAHFERRSARRPARWHVPTA